MSPNTRPFYDYGPQETMAHLGDHSSPNSDDYSSHAHVGYYLKLRDFGNTDFIEELQLWSTRE
jgi:hypothetical protein